MTSLDITEYINIIIGKVKVKVNKESLLLMSNVFKNINIKNELILPKTDLLYNDNKNIGFLKEEKYWEILVKLIENPNDFNTIILQYIPFINIMTTLPNLTKEQQRKLLINVYKMNIFIYIGMISFKYDFTKIYDKCMNNIISIAMFPKEYNKYIFIVPTIMNNPFINHNIYLKLIRITKNYDLFFHYLASHDIINNVVDDLQLYFQKNDLLDNIMNHRLNVVLNH